MVENFPQLNHDKTEVLFFGPEGMREKLLPKCHNLKPTQFVKNFNVIFDSELSFNAHIKNVTKTGFYPLKNIAKVCPALWSTEKDCL